MLIISKNQSVITLRIDLKAPRTWQFLPEIGQQNLYFHPVSQPKNWSADRSLIVVANIWDPPQWNVTILGY
jgi:hypothetical protein